MDAVQTTRLLLVAPRTKGVDASTQNLDVVQISTPKPKVPTMKVVPVTRTNLDVVPMVLLVPEDLTSKVLMHTFVYLIFNNSLYLTHSLQSVQDAVVNIQNLVAAAMVKLQHQMPVVFVPARLRNTVAALME